MVTLTSCALAVATVLASPAGLSDEDIAVIVQQALENDARTLALSADELGRAANRRPDLVVARDVQALLRNRIGPRIERLSVSSSEGTVELRGTAADAADIGRAEQLARAVPGVREVVNAISTPGADAAAPAAPRPQRVAGPGVAGPFRFLTADGLAGADVMIEVDDGVVRLGGTASSAKARDYATATSRQVSGVRLVINDMIIRSGSRTDDDGLERLIRRRIEWSEDVRDASVEVTARNGVVRLSGRVRTTSQRAEAESLATSTRGVLVVDNQLVVGR